MTFFSLRLSWPERGQASISIPAVEGAVARLVHVVESLAEIEDILVSTATLDDRVGQVAGQPVNIDGISVIVATSVLDAQASS